MWFRERFGWLARGCGRDVSEGCVGSFRHSFGGASRLPGLGWSCFFFRLREEFIGAGWSVDYILETTMLRVGGEDTRLW